MRATLIGATGLIGSHLLEMLLNDPYFDRVRVLIRRPMEKVHPKLEKCLLDFDDRQAFSQALQNSDVIFCAIGTTQKKVKGDTAAYRKVDFDITVNAAQWGKQNGCENFVFVSAVGANTRSRNFYLRLKGEIEEAVIQSGIRSVHILQPSVLLGNRKEFRLGEKLAVWLMPLLSFLLPKKYRPIHSEEVAKAMIVAAISAKDGHYCYQYEAIKSLSLTYATDS